MTERSVVKRKTSITPDGTVRTGFMSATFMTGENIENDIDAEREAYLRHPGVETAEEAYWAYVLTVRYRDGNVTVITYSND